MLGWVKKFLAGDVGDPALLDHVDVNRREQILDDAPATKPPGAGLSQHQKLALAAARLGKPFACAADGLPRKIIKDGVEMVVGVPSAPPDAPLPNVASIRKARSA